MQRMTTLLSPVLNSRSPESNTDEPNMTKNGDILIPPMSPSSNSVKNDCIRVVVRARPMNKTESERGDQKMVQFQQNNNSSLDIVSTSSNGKHLVRNFSFNFCASEDISQIEFFQSCGITSLLESALKGYSATVFAYGQTGSGKTYSMSGEEELLGCSTRIKTKADTDSDGIIPRSISYMFNYVDNRDDGTTFTIKASYCEIYNEQVYDLLNTSTNHLNVRWNDRNGFYVQNLLVVQCDSIDDLTAVIDEGHKNRRVGSHDMNKDSSRSHSILTVNIDIKCVTEEGHASIKYGKISFVDLAGSERLKDTRSTNAEETSNINKSLFTLGKVISALGLDRGSNFVPYRDSKLTKLLMDSLGGNSLTLMISCISPSNLSMDETLSTLNYATRAKNIQNKATVTIDPKEKLINDLLNQNKLLRGENESLKRKLLASSQGKAVDPVIQIANIPKSSPASLPIQGNNKLLMVPTPPSDRSNIGFQLRRAGNLPSLVAPPISFSPDTTNKSEIELSIQTYQRLLIQLQQENAQLRINNDYIQHNGNNFNNENNNGVKFRSNNNSETLQQENDKLKQALLSYKGLANCNTDKDSNIRKLEQLENSNQSLQRRLASLQKREKDLMSALARQKRASSNQ